jgi:lipopolysaccharide/colanic/teichoic acid biosynthesis glycosyltransferase
LASYFLLDDFMISLPGQDEELMSQEYADHWEGVDRGTPTQSPYSRRFGWLGSLVGVIMMIFALPFIISLVILTKLTSRGPGIYRQTRVGFRGNVFTVYKIRTMANDAEAKSGPVWTSGVSDPRVTALGKFMRVSHLDELPQLFNILKGNMALIGPRPERPEFTQFLAREIPGYVGRLSVKPGITGLAQIVLPADSDLASVRKKLELDLEYVKNSNFILDLKIVVCTAMKMAGLKSSDVASWMGLAAGREGSASASVVGVQGFKRLFRGDQNVKADADNQQSEVRRSVSLDELVEKTTHPSESGEVEVSEVLHSEANTTNTLSSEETAKPGSEVAGTKDPDSGSVDPLPAT